MSSPPTPFDLRRAEAATWGTRSDPPAERSCMRLVSWKPLAKNSLRGFATVELPIGLQIADIPVLVGKNGPWASLPSKPVLDHDGTQKRDANGKAAYVPILSWHTRDLSNRFSDSVVALVREADAHALDDGAP